MSANALFQKILEKPAMYFGNRDGYLRDIEAFDVGYAAALNAKRCFIPVGFKQYIQNTLASDYPTEFAWFTLIRQRADGEKAEWNLFKQLWKDFESRTGI